MRAKNHSTDEKEVRSNGTMDVAVVGMACRFPGADDYDQYWQNIVSGRNCISEVPPDRWDWRQYFGDPRVEPNKTSVKWGGFIDDLDKFDPLFFGIAPNEAAFIDPQHRLFLETAWHAVEDAGYSVGSLSGKAIGVYAGVSKNDYAELMRESRYEIAPYISTGTVHSILANRVSFLFNLHGRSEVVDTACSSSLVALHNAIRDIANGECEAAIVGGVNALITPTMFISHSKSGMLSPDGQCKTFSAAANGYVRSEGVGVLFIKPLHRALSDGDHVHAVIKSSAINHGGRSNFLTSPTTEAQAAVVMNALRRGGLDPRTIGLIEAHGTGTPLGDPIEINGLKKAFAQLASELSEHREMPKPHCALSAVKTNIGHLESAAGMAGMIKAIMAMKHRQIPGVRNFDKLNPYIELDGSPFSIATETTFWEAREHPRRAGVSSFGMGGVNAHVVLEEAPEAEVAAGDEKREYVFSLSAKKGRLKAYADAFLKYLLRADRQRLPLRDIAFTVENGRDRFDERLTVVAASADELIAKLERYVANGVANEAPVQDAAVGHAGRRVPLPTYPFARKRCWFTDVPSRVSGVAHPEPPTGRAEKNPAATSLEPTDFFIRDHVVQGKTILPGVVHLELARAAGPSPVRLLKDVYWMTPVVVEGDAVPVEIRLTPRNGRVDFELLQGETVHSKGSLADLPSGAQTPARLDIAAIQSRCTAGQNKAELYALLREHGLAYGSSFQVIENNVENDRELLAEVKLPREAHDTLAKYALHPSIMDGVFQAVTALSLQGLEHSGKQFVPFHLEAAEIVNRTAGHCFVHATRSNASVLSFHATLTDRDGNVLVRITNLQKRPIAERAEKADISYRPVWRRKALAQPPANAGRNLLLFAHDDSAAQAFRESYGTVVLVRPGTAYRVVGDVTYEINPSEPADYERLLQELKDRGLAPARVAYLWSLDVLGGGDVRSRLATTIYGVFHFTQAALKAKLRENVSLVYAYPLGEDLASSVHAMVAGFARTLKYENPKFDYLTVGIDQPSIEQVARAVAAELGFASHANALREVAYRGGERIERTVVRAAVPDRDETPVIQPGGVYVVAGGAGGLGAVFSRHFAEKYGATILWLGRSAMNAAIAAKISAIEKVGGNCEYFSVDITDRAALSAVIARIKETHGRIDGVIHAAGLIEDSFILRKESASFARVVEPKVLGAIYLDELTRNEALDFFIVFSSIAALMPNQGQCDYAAANSFLDSFAEARNRLTADRQRSGVSLAMNWPLWAHGGMRVSAEEERHLLKAFGMKPLATANGLEVFETSLALAKNNFPEIHQVIAIGGDQEKIERSLGVVASPVASEGQLETELKSIFAARLAVKPEAIASGRTIGELGIDSLSIVGVIQDINGRFNAGLKPTLLFDINTVEKLAAYLVEIGKDKLETPRWNRSLIDVEQSDRARRTFSRTFRTSEFYLRDHVVDEQYNMPGACYVEMARQAGDLLLGDGSVKRLLHNYWASPLSSPEEDFTAHVEITPKQEQFAYEVVSFTAAGEKRLHAMGQIAQEPASHETRLDLDAIRSRCTEIQHPQKIYEQILGEGLIVGPTFQPMTQIFLNDDEALAILELPEEIRSTAGDYVLHPALLTGAFQAALVSNRRAAGSRRYIPIGMDELEVLAPIPADCCIYSRSRSANARNEEMRKFDVEICRPDGGVVVRLKGFSIRALKESSVPAEARSHAVASAPNSEGIVALLAAVQELIKSRLAGPIGLPADEIDVAVAFDQYGVTSVMVVELNQIFEELLGPIPKTLFFEYRNVTELAEYFLESHGEVLARLVKEQQAPVAPAIANAGGADPIDDVREYLRALVAGPIGVAPDEIDVYTGFDQYGVNSVMVVELNERFEKVFGPLSKTLFFEYRSIDELSRYFLDEHRTAILSVLPKAVVTAPAVSIEEAPRPQVTSVVVEERHDIAIVSMAGRFPGARNLDEFWDVLREGRDCITEIPADRFNYRRYYDADPEQNGIYSKWGGFIDDVDRFDPAFFNISPREAELIDPQERLLLEVVWEMLERAGYTRQRLQRLSDRRVGVFVGALWQPYESAGVEATLAGNVVGPSSLLYSIANRISYFFDLAGPSMAIDTACSSSLTALHLACQSIRDGESQFAIAAGVNLSLSVSKYLFLSRYRFLSTDGRCRSYGAGGDGYVPGEGVCALLLKPLAKAVADGDSILAVIKGSAINHGGRTNGYTVPNPKSQANVIATALENGHVDPRSISYIDGHGTGTSLGDPIEIAGLEKALGLSRDGDRAVAIGSVKSNIGHLEAAAGVASIIKVLLQMQHGQLVPSLHSDELNPNIDFGKSRFRVQRELAPWTPEAARCAGVSSFGAGGSNAHVILEQYAGPAAAVVSDSEKPALCLFSARTEERLFELVRRFNEHLAGLESANIHDIAYTLQVGREAMRERLAVVAGSVAELKTALAAFLERRPQSGNWRRGRVPKVGHEVAETWWENKNISDVADGWVQGREIDWSRFYGGRNYRFLPLPTYPFAKERYWLDCATPGTIAPAAIHLHPLLHRNTSDGNEQRYSSTFTGEEFFLADHLIRTDGRRLEKILPGVAYLEMARAAIEQASPAPPEGATLELLNTVWMRPFVVAPEKRISVTLSVNGDEVRYEIHSQDGATRIVHCQGRAVWNRQSAPATLDLEQLTRQMGQARLDPNRVYGLLAERGLALGSSFQAVAAIQLGNDQLLAHLRLPNSVEGQSSGYVLHPALMDGALHGSLGLIDGWSGRPEQTRVPFTLESLQVLAPCVPEMSAWMRYSDGTRAGDAVAKLDVDLCDAQGGVRVRIKGFASRALKGGPAEPTSALMTLAPVWDAVPVSAAEHASGAGERVMVIGGDHEQYRAVKQQCSGAEVLPLDGRATVAEIAQTLREGARVDHLVWILPASTKVLENCIEEQEQGVLFGFRLIKALLNEGYGARQLRWTVVTNGTQRIVRDETVAAAHASVHGLIGSMAKEYRNWQTRLVDLAGGAWPWNEILQLRFDERGDGWGWRDGQWYRRRLVASAPAQGSEGGFQRRGVYVVIGGSGGVGEVVSEHLARRYDAQVVWIGRREHDETIERKLDRITAGGGERPLYISADARKREDLERACNEIKERLGRINGVIHSAVVLADKSLANMDEEQFRAALSTKVETAVRMAQVFGREPLDFLLYFSSLQSFLKAPGQSNYAAGCTFTDALAEWQSANAAYPVKVMNWGYWGSVGVAATAEHRERMAQIGWGSLEAEDGMAGLEQLLRGSLPQLGIIRTVGAQAARSLGIETGGPVVTLQPRQQVVAAAADGLQETAEAWLVDAIGTLLKVKRDDVDVEAELSEFGFDSLTLTALANHVNQAFALELMPTVFFERPTVRRFAGYLVEKHGEPLAEKLGARKQAVATAPGSISGLLEKVEPWLVQAIGSLLKIRREEVDVEAELSEFGFDSLTLTGFANHVNQAFALELMPTVFFEHPTVRRFAKHLVEKHAEQLIAKLGREEEPSERAAQPAVTVVTRVQEQKAEAAEAIAIIGMSGRFPEANDLDAFWENLKGGRDSVREIPSERWDWRAVGGEEGGGRWGAFMEGVEQFDPLFFGISPREAERMDPQHRLTMMYGWKAFEDAGYAPKQLWGSRTGVFIGTTNTGYSEQLTQAGIPIEGYTATGLVPSVGPNRLSYVLNLHGPSEPIETACSSSLVAVHRAIRSILVGECDLALAGGVNTLFPILHMSFTRAGMLSPDGRCKTFSGRADGYVRGEGAAMVVLKRLSAAERDGDHIYGVIRGSAENHGGRAQSLTAPNANAQAALIADAFRRAGVSPASVSYIEAHGTGTPLGDPVEINGLKNAFQTLAEEMGETAAVGYCGVGSVKTNVGHLELAAGIAGLVKILLQMKHKTLVPSLHCEEINPYIRLEESPFYIVRENRPWTRLPDGKGGEWPRRAGVSSFGFGGVNSHVVVEEYVGADSVARNAGPVMVVLSAKDAERLKAQAAQLREWIARNEWTGNDLAGVAYTLQVGREAMDHRLALAVASMQELDAKLASFLDGKTSVDGLYRGEVKRNSETLALFRGDEELHEAVGKWMQRGKWSKLLELWVKGLEIEWEQLYGAEKPRRVSLPTYPFAQVRCWIDASASVPAAAVSGSISVFHPLLHRNTSDLSEQRYSSIFTGEEFFLADHQVRTGRTAQKVLPGVAYLEMARAAVRQASRHHASSTLELHDTVWLQPVVIAEPLEVSIRLAANGDDSITYEVYSADEDHETVHCRGQVAFRPSAASATLDLDRLRRGMTQGRWSTSDLYAMCETMGLHYGPAHRGVAAIDLGENELLAELQMPDAAAADQHQYVLHPSIIDGALQASLALLVDRNDVPARPHVPFAVDSVHIVSVPTAPMIAWVRQAKHGAIDIDLCDPQGHVAVQIRGFASRLLDGGAKAAVRNTVRHRLSVESNGSAFDESFYESLVADIVHRKVSAEEAAELE